MKRLVPCLIAATLAISGLLLILRPSNLAQEPKDANKGWVDYDPADLKQKDRLKDRPGNYQVLAALGEFLDAWYQIRRDYSQCAFPFQDDSRNFQNLQEADKYLDELAKGVRSPRNKLRQFNININGLTMYDPDKVLSSPDLLKRLGHKSRQDRLAAVRKAHPGRAVLVLADIELQSLQSPKIEGGGPDDPGIFYVVHSAGRWKVAWVDN